MTDERTRCAGCGKTIVWGTIPSATGGPPIRVPLDPTPAVYRLVKRHGARTEVARDNSAMVSHFATCPKAAEFSRSKYRDTPAESG